LRREGRMIGEKRNRYWGYRWAFRRITGPSRRNPPGRPLLVARFVADLVRTPRYGLRSAPAGAAKGGRRSPHPIPKQAL